MQLYENPAVVADVARQILPDHHHLIVERVSEGGSTAVYRVRSDTTVYYLRVLPEVDASFGPEAYIHTTLRAWSLHVPEVLYFEPYNVTLQRSIMLTAPIAGQAIGNGTCPPGVDHILRCAGRELARINSLPVQGFGWVQRPLELKEGLSAEYPTYPEWLHQDFEAPLLSLGQSDIFSTRDYQAIQSFKAEAIALFEGEPAVLAHGDFDGTHIYQHEGAYTGIIDFGEIRGAHRWYDIGHFWTENRALLPPLLEGYAEVTPLPTGYERRIHLTALLIAARRLGRRLAKGAEVYRPDVEAVQTALAGLGLRSV